MKIFRAIITFILLIFMLPNLTTKSANGLNPSGPWLVYTKVTQDGNEIWAVNPDGTNPTLLEQYKESSLFYFDAQFVVASPTQPYIVFPLFEHEDDITLNLLKLPEGTTRPIARVLTNEVKKLQDIDIRTLVQPFLDPTNLTFQWAPDSKSIAFIGVTETLKSELFLYSLTDNKIIQLTDNDVRPYSLRWSPTGEYILYNTDYFGEPLGPQRLWAIDIISRKILSVPADLPDVWLTSTKFIFSRKSLDGGFGVYTFDLQTMKKRLLYPGFFNAYNVNPDADKMLIMSEGFLCDKAPCIFMIAPRNTELKAEAWEDYPTEEIKLQNRIDVDIEKFRDDCCYYTQILWDQKQNAFKVVRGDESAEEQFYITLDGKKSKPTRSLLLEKSYDGQYAAHIQNGEIFIGQAPAFKLKATGITGIDDLGVGYIINRNHSEDYGEYYRNLIWVP